LNVFSKACRLKILDGFNSFLVDFASMRLYLDSNVYISLVREEMGRHFQNLSYHSLLFVSFCAKNNITLVLSRLFFEEVNRIISLSTADVLDFFKEANVHIELVSCPSLHEESAQLMKQTGIHYADAMHVVFAQKSACAGVVTWNSKDFDKTRRIISNWTPKSFMEDFWPMHHDRVETNTR
jgi:predicted nucleic acid-binding protein